MTTNTQGQWHTVDIDTLPLALCLEDAAALCGLSIPAAYWLVHHDWKKFTKFYGNQGRLIRTRRLLAWLGETEDEPATNNTKETNGNG